ncbi:MAG: hypothetical protein ABW321_05235 [Polyangiales bacterium]
MGFQQRARFLAALGGGLLVGLLQQWPSVAAGGFRGDDYVQRAMARAEFPSPRSVFDLFSFAAGTPDDLRRSTDFGYLPWWTHPELRLRMWRPLASGLIALDYRLFQDHATLHHLHSLLWFGLLLWAAARVLWRVLPPSAATIALIVFAGSPCHTLPVGWLANRSTLLACALAFAALEWHLRASHATEPESHRSQLGRALLASLALLCGEYALTALAYALAFSVFDRRRPWRQQLTAATPLLLPIAGYLVLHSLVGSDIVHSGYYLSPLGAPREFARAVVTRAPVLAADLLLALPSLQFSAGSPWRNKLLMSGYFTPDVWMRLPDWTTWHVVIGYVAIGLGWLAWRAVLYVPAARRAPGWLVLGAGLSLLPGAGSLPEDRLLVAGTLGASALVGSLLASARMALQQATTLRARAHVGFGVALSAWIAVSALTRGHDDARTLIIGSEIGRAFCTTAEMPPPERAATTRVYVIAAADFNTAVNLPWLRLVELGAPLPRSYRRLSTGPMPLEITRPSERVLELNVLVSDTRGSAVPSLYRDQRSPLLLGQRHLLPGLMIDVLEITNGNPGRMRFEFDRSVDDPELWFLLSSEHGLQHHVMPRVGESQRLPFAQYVDMRPH